MELGARARYNPDACAPLQVGVLLDGSNAAVQGRLSANVDISVQASKGAPHPRKAKEPIRPTNVADSRALRRHA